MDPIHLGMDMHLGNVKLYYEKNIYKRIVVKKSQFLKIGRW